MEQDEIYLIDLWRIFAREWRWFVGVLAFVLLATFGFSHLVKPQWEATAWIQIGQVAQTIAGQDQKIFHHAPAITSSRPAAANTAASGIAIRWLRPRGR